MDPAATSSERRRLTVELVKALEPTDLGHAQAETTKRHAHLAADPLRAASDAVAVQIAAAVDATRDTAAGGNVVALPRGRRRRTRGTRDRPGALTWPRSPTPSACPAWGADLCPCA